MKYDIEIIKKVLSEFENGKNKLQLSKEFLIPRHTIKYWIDNKSSIYTKYKKTDKTLEQIKSEVAQKKELYNFILGLYLGDGCISQNKMSYKLRIVQDKKYERSVIEIKNALEEFFGKKAKVQDGKGCKILIIYDKNLPLYFPQHGNGKKHNRDLSLVEFQRENLNYEFLMKGLWTADGSFYKTSKNYEGYNFSNKSTDLIDFFEECLNHFRILYSKRVKQNGVWVIEIRRKLEIIKMKKVVGIKS